MQIQTLNRTGQGHHDGAEPDRHHGRRGVTADLKMSRIDWLMVVTLVTVAALMGYLADNGWLPELLW